MPINLPDSPSGEQYEDFIAACLRVQGYFVETRIVLREGTKEVLELDVVATAAGSNPPAVQLYEVKKDGMSFPNVFKLFGQRTYLGIETACLVSLKDVDPLHAPIYASRAAEMGVRVCAHPLDFSAASQLAPPQCALEPAICEEILSALWYQQIARRLAYAAFSQESKRNRGDGLFDRARNYSFNLAQTFFSRSPLARAEGLYQAYMDAPNLSGDFVTRVAAGAPVQPTWAKVNDRNEFYWIQAVMQMENTARCAVIKNALDDFLIRGDNPPPTVNLSLGSSSFEIPAHHLPESFWTGVQTLRNHPHALRLPYLFQTFVDTFGGFIFFKDQEELSLLSHMTGIPSDEVIDSLYVLNEFFAPGGGSWFYTQRNELLCQKMVPGFVRGGGCFLRKSAFGFKEYSDRYPDMGWLLAHWHNAAYFLLEPELKVTRQVN